MGARDLNMVLDPEWRARMMPHARLSITDMAVLEYLAYRVNPRRGYAYASLRRMAADLDTSHETVVRIVQRLMDAGFVRSQRTLEVATGKRLANHYFLPTGPPGDPWHNWQARRRDSNGDHLLEFQYDGVIEDSDDDRIDDHENHTP